jgi:hypothetical protein
MNALLDSAFGLDGMGFSDPQAIFEFARPLPAWVWAVVLGLVCALAALSYIRLTAPSRPRVVLAVCRVVLVMMLLILASGPQLRKANERVEPDWVIMLLDRSQSMQIADAGPPGARATRDEQLRAAIAAAAPAFESIELSKRVLWLGFDSAAYELDANLARDLAQLPAAAGRNTAVGSSLESALARVAARPVSAIVLATDGQSTDTPSRAVRRLLERQRVPVFALPLGSAEPMTDLAIRRVQAPEIVFVDDVVTVAVELEQRGSAAVGSARVQLRDLATDEILDEQPLEIEPGSTNLVRLSARLADAGTRRLGLTVLTDTPDLVADNNTAQVSVELVDRPLRVLYVDGYPRWEHRYIKTLLLRERSIRSSSLLLAANRRYLQEGDVEIDTLPRSVEEWAEYDVVMIGDIRPELLGEGTLADLRQHVAERGAGLIWLAGPGATPLAWRGTPLADLLPMVLDSEQAVTPFAQPMTMRRTPAAADLRLFELADATDTTIGDPGWPQILSDHRTGWSRLQWAQRIATDAIKPGALALATFEADGDSVSAPHPSVLMMRFGAGVSVYVATDETWRWRYGRGEALTERFWVPLIRQLGRASLARGDRAMLLTATPEQGYVGQPVRVGLELLDQSLIDAQPSAAGVRIASDQAETKLALDPQSDGLGRQFGGSWVPDRPGRYVVSVDDPLLPKTGESRVVHVLWADDESRRPQTNHGLIEELASQTGGSILTAEGLADLEAILPNRAVTIAGQPEIATLWDKPLFLVILVVLFAAEWVGRRLMRLA